MAILRKPWLFALGVLAVGGGAGATFHLLVGEPTFGMFGSLTVALALMTFGTLASELLTYSQGTWIMGDDHEPGAPYTFSEVRKALLAQTLVGVIGTLQWGFGDFLFVRFGLE